MTWGEFKELLESQEITDEMEIEFIDVDGDVTEVEINENGSFWVV